MNANTVLGVALQVGGCNFLEHPCLVSRVLVDKDSDSVVPVRVDPHDVACAVAVPVREVQVAAVDLGASRGPPEIGYPRTPVRLTPRYEPLSGVWVD